MPEVEVKTKYTLGQCKIAVMYIIIAIILAVVGSIYLAMYAEYASITRSVLSLICNIVVALFVGMFIAGFCGEKGKAMGIAVAAIILQLLGFCLFVTIKNVLN